MTTVSKWVMAAIIASVILAMLRRPAATVGIVIAGGEEAKGIFGAFSGANDTSKGGQKGSFNIGSNKLAFG